MLLFSFGHQCFVIEIDILYSRLEVSNFPHERALNLWNPNIITFSTHAFIRLLNMFILFRGGLLIRCTRLRFRSYWNFIIFSDIFHLNVGLWIFTGPTKVSAHRIHLNLLAFPIFNNFLFLFLFAFVRVIKGIVVIEPRAVRPGRSRLRGKKLILIVVVISWIL